MNQLNSLCILLAALLSCGTLYGINSYVKGDSLYVIAKSGLNLRTGPNRYSVVRTIIPYGDQVLSLEQRHPYGVRMEELDSVRIIPPMKWKNSEQITHAYWMTGRWVKVQYQELEGYVFDGYLSHHEPFKFFPDGRIESLQEYVMREYKLLRSDTITYELDEKEPHIIHTYDNGCVLHEVWGAKAGGTIIYVHNFSIEELMLYISYINEYEKRNSNMYLIKANRKNEDYTFEGDIDGIRIRAFGSMLVVSYSNWC
ncbi:MAG: hypothetical protein AAFR36_31080 [Bacteroidota bacterium]